MASVLVVAGLIVFAGSASAHNNIVQSSGSCGHPAGTGATITWTVVNDFPASESGSASATGGGLNTTALSIASSPTYPANASNQVFTQTLTAAELATLLATPSQTVTFNWSATWTSHPVFSTTGSGTFNLSELVNGCVAPAPIASQTATQASASGIVLGQSVTDTATVTGTTAGGLPTGNVAFTVCGPMASVATCPSGTPVGSAVTLGGSGHTATATSASFKPTAPGTYCFGAVYTPGQGSNYLTSSDNISGTAQSNECFSMTAPNFTVTKADMPATGTAVPPSSTINYTIAIKNVGNAAGTTTVTDVVPSSLTVKGTPTCVATLPDTCSVANPSGSSWTFTASLAPGDSATATFATTVAASASGTITNTATITDGSCTTASGCSSTVSNPVTLVTTAVTVTPPTTPAPATTPATTPPSTHTAAPVTSPSTTPTIAFTGAPLSQQWLIGLAALMLGSGLVFLARWRRRIPRHAASKR